MFGDRVVQFLRMSMLAGFVACSVFQPGVAAVLPARPLPQRPVRPLVVPPAATWRAVPTGRHTFYGTITRIAGTLITVRLRNGDLQNVDASAAIAHGDYSSPLFVGKFVSVDGNQRNGTFIAAHVFRLASLLQLQADR
jgi:hypothetical protein